MGKTDKNDRPPFQAVELDAIDARLETKAREKGIPTLVAPGGSKRKKRAGEGSPQATPRARNKEVSKTRPTTPDTRHLTPEPATPRERMKALTIELPDYVWIDLKTRAARDMVSVRHLIMRMMREAGVAIEARDMIEDGRRLRGRNGVEDPR